MSSKSGCQTRSELLELCRVLRQEKLFVENEKSSLRDLNEKVKLASKELSASAWISRRQRVNLDELLLRSADPSASVLRANLLKSASFIDGYKVLQHQEILYTEFLKALRDKPKLLATVLSLGCKLNLPGLQDVEDAIFSGLYGSCFMTDDEALTLELLHHLMSATLSDSQNPRKILRAGKCSFSRIYKSFIEEIFSTKLFLTTALFEPILSLLTEDEIFLDVDPSKALIRFPPAERAKKFGQEGTPEYAKRLKQHRQFIIKKLEGITRKFINGIRDNIRSFPPSLSRLLRAMYSLLIKSFELKEVHAICFDVIFCLFICPAIVDPNPVGIIDTPVSYIARSNLMQVAHILQVLCMQKWEEIDPKHMDLFSRFDKDSMFSIFENILELGLSNNNDEVLRNPMTESNAFAGISAGTTIAGNVGFNDGSRLSRLAVLLTRNQLDQLVSFLRQIRDSNDGQLPSSMANELSSILAPLPETTPGAVNGMHSMKQMEQPVPNGKPAMSKNSFSARLTAMKSGASGNSPEADNGVSQSQEADTVLVIPLFDPSCGSDLPGLLSEEQVLSRSRQSSRVRMTLPNSDGSGNEVLEKRTRFSLGHDEGSIGNTSDNLEAISEAASNHSATSSLEDEADQEDVDNPIIDNLSDMVSANVSGRGTPNVSGRDTPSSQVPDDDEVIRSGRNEGDEPRGAVGGLQSGSTSRRHPPIHPTKSGQADLEEKFGRFEIKPQIKSRGVVLGAEGGDETVSLISDTWSTDVLGSDTETLGEILVTSSDRFPPNNQNFADMDAYSRNLILEEFATSSSAGAAAALPQRMSGIQPSMPPDSTSSVNLLDVGDTASEAWSIDVLDGDTESLGFGELDIEYISSTVSGDDSQFMDSAPRRHRNADLLLAGDNSPGASGPLTGGNLLLPSRDSAVEQWACSSAVGGMDHQDDSIRRGSDSSSSAAVPGLSSPSTSKCPHSMDKAPIEEPSPAATLSSHLSAASIASSSGSSGDAPPDQGSRKNVLVPSSSTGAIPKCLPPESNKKSGRAEKFSFKNWKLPKISRSRSSAESFRCTDNKMYHSQSNSLDNPSHHSVDGSMPRRTDESSDDILNKYRSKKHQARSPPSAAVGNLIDISDSSSRGGPPEEVDPRLIIDHNNLENCYAFKDAKRKLRLTLSSVDLSMMPDICHASSVEPEVIWLLKVQLSEALNLQDRNFIAQLHETLRCLSLFKKDGVSRILNSLKEEYKRRSPYMAYLVRCRQGLLCTLSRQERLLSRMNIDRDVCTSYLVYVVVRFFLEERESMLHQFVQKFKELTVPDEKTSLMNSFLSSMNESLQSDPIWSSVCSQEQLELSTIAIERSITSHIYFFAMYPNGEADINRDEVLSEHIRRLGNIITPSHKDLRIPLQYHYEQPWPSAQAEIRRLAAFKTPADKVACIRRASQTIMNLLSLGSPKGSPAADDFIPVLVFVLIKANPPSLLSTVQYVDNFYGERLSGEDQYWWTQTVAAIEFIKTMDY